MKGLAPWPHSQGCTHCGTPDDSASGIDEGPQSGVRSTAYTSDTTTANQALGQGRRNQRPRYHNIDSAHRCAVTSTTTPPTQGIDVLEHHHAVPDQEPPARHMERAAPGAQHAQNSSTTEASRAHPTRFGQLRPCTKTDTCTSTTTTRPETYPATICSTLRSQSPK